MRKVTIALGVVAACGGTALASERCAVAMADWKPREALQSKLESEGWQVRSIRNEDGCYEADAIDAEGHTVEAHFDPQTFRSIDVKIAD